MAELAALAATIGSTLSSAASTIAPIATVIGTGVSAMGTIAAGKAAKQSADYEAAQLEIKAKEEKAAGQRQAQEFARRKDHALSTLQARGASSGFTATDPTTLAIADEIARYGTMQEQMAEYGGTSRMVGTQAQAEGRRMEGRAASSGARSKAFGTILGGIADIGSKYNPRPAQAGGASYRYG